jgi:hypothetical protein
MPRGPNRRRDELRRWLLNPHPESTGLVDLGLGAWFNSLPQEDTAALVDESVGKSIRWISGEGWVDEPAPDDASGDGEY